MMFEVLVVTAPAEAAAPASSQHSLYDYLSVLGPLSLTLTCLVIFLTVLVVITAVALGLVEMDFGAAGLTAKLRRPAGKVNSTHVLGVESATEDVPALVAENEPIEGGIASIAEEEARDHEPTAKDDSWSYFTAKNLHDLDKFWPIFAADISAESQEFWETNHLRRRANHGADHGRKAVQQLAVDHPTWAAPIAPLIDWSVEDGDIPSADAYLATGLTRQASPQFEEVLLSGLKLKFKTGGPALAMAFCFEWAKSSIPERTKAAMFLRISEQLKSSGAQEGYRIAYEWAMSICPSLRNNAFPLAYNYGSDNSHWMMALATYSWTTSNSDHGPLSRNNIGVTLSSLDKQAQIESYELAVAGGDKFAIANLARLLLEDGFISAGERLLATIGDPGSAAELHASTLTRAHSARRRLEDKQLEIRQAIAKQVDPVRAAIFRSYRYLSGEPTRPEGHFVSDDNSIQLLLTAEIASCKMLLGALLYEGAIPWQTTCYSGNLRSEGAGVFSSGIELTVLVEGANSVRVVRWPQSVGLNNSLDIVELRHSESEPATLSVPPPDVSGNILGSLLLAHQPKGTS